MFKILDRYILKELFPPFLVSITFFSFVFLLSRILEIADMIVNLNIPLLSVGKLLLYSMPFYMQFTIPMSVMMAVMLTFLELSSSNEILALKAGGISILRLIPSVLIFCSLGIFLTGIMTFYGLPWGKLSFKKEVSTIASENLSIGLKEKTFIDSFAGFSIFINKIDNDSQEIQGVFIEDKKSSESPVTITAPKGRFLKNQNGFALELLNGSIIQVLPEDNSVHKTSFGKYTFGLNPGGADSSESKGRKDDEEMYFKELISFINGLKEKNDKYYSAVIKLHEKFSLPMACLFLGLIAFPLGLKNTTGKKSSGIMYGLGLFVFYYLMLALGWSLGESEPDIYPPFLAMWTPNFVICAIGLYFLYLCIKERDINLKFWTWLKR